MKKNQQLDFSGLKVMDNHCHLFNVEYTPHELERVLSMSLNPMPQEQLRHTMVYRKMLLELGRLLGTDGSEQEVLKVRESRIREGYKKYVETLFYDAGIYALIVDLGYKPAEVDLQIFKTLVPAQVHYIFRIESVLDELWNQFKGQKIQFRPLEDQFYQSLDDAFRSPDVVAIKSIIGYRTGLHVQMVDRSWLIKSKPTEKAFRDFFLLRAMEKAREKGVPVQIHAAFGESNIDILNNNPALLKGMLDQPEYSKVQIILVHGGYPYCFEAGYLASVYPNVYVDLSEMIPFVPLGARSGMSHIFDMCPFNKILYGSDGFLIPEIHWLGAKMAKDAIESLFSEYVREGLFDSAYAMQVAKMVFCETAQRIYGLEDAL